MTDQFDMDNRTEERIGGDIDRSPSTKRLQTLRPERATQGRIIVTLHYDIERKLWGPGDGDAVDILRRDVKGLPDDRERIASWVADEIKNNRLITNIDVDATK